MNIVDKLNFYLEFPFVRYAILVGVLIALCSSLLGVTLVVKKQSFLGDGLSHVAFAVMALATVLNLGGNTLITLGITSVIAVVLLQKGELMGKRGDAALALISVTSLAAGYLILNLFSTSANISADVCTTLFGSTSILTLKSVDVWISIGISIFVVLFMIIYHNRIFAMTFDSKFASVTKLPEKKIQLLLGIITAIVIVLAMKVVGSLLITAFIVFPSLSAMELTNTYKKSVILSAVFSMFGAFFGILVSILFSTPVGATIVIMDLMLFLTSKCTRTLRKGIL